MPMRETVAANIRTDPTVPTVSPLVSSFRPRVKTISTDAVMRRPELNMTAVSPSTPRSLRAFPVQLNQGAVRIEMKIMEKPTIGVMIPK